MPFILVVLIENELMPAQIVEMLLRSGFSRACIGVDSITSIITPVYENGGMAKIIPGSGNLHFSVLVRPAPSFSSVLIWSSETPFDNELSTQFLLGNRSSSDTANTQVGALHDQIINDVLVRGASFNARCCILKALLWSPHLSHYVRDIENIAETLCDSWWNGDTEDGKAS